jgi:hypothetical protein
MRAVPDKAAYAEAMREYGVHPIRVEMTVVQLTMILSTLQLALRHPRYPEAMRPYVAEFLEGAIEHLTHLSPVIGEVMAAGNDPTHDVEASP